MLVDELLVEGVVENDVEVIFVLRQRSTIEHRATLPLERDAIAILGFVLGAVVGLRDANPAETHGDATVI
jgi:hypothetical protein